jgi:hypothetical protein
VAVSPASHALLIGVHGWDLLPAGLTRYRCDGAAKARSGSGLPQASQWPILLGDLALLGISSPFMARMTGADPALSSSTGRCHRRMTTCAIERTLSDLHRG